ncbi:MAG TPA: hypothetical protein VGQ62_21440 [Chloroflexota bacterium]|nr:hypothetical protein [Chloroflexota bacterium]
MPDQDNVLVETLKSTEDNRRIALSARRWIVSRQIHGHRSVAAGLQLRNQILPAPPTVPGPMHKAEGRHG